MEERLKQQLDFILEIDKEKNILRQTHLSGHGRRENDAEHAWHMAIMAYLLKDYVIRASCAFAIASLLGFRNIIPCCFSFNSIMTCFTFGLL